VLERKLGEGGMALVYLARDRQLDRSVAVKVLRPELSESLGRDRFLREIRIEANLQHPNVLPIFDSGQADGLLYYTMPYVEGESLRVRLRREGQLPIDQALRITREVAEALAHAHARGIVHRDIKPGNILLSSKHAVVADFGIARAFTAAGAEPITKDTATAGTPTGMAIGTPEYMSPEQVAGDSTIDGRSDQYALACVVFEMLAGDPPFTGRTMQSVISRQLTEPPPSLEHRRSKAPRNVIDAVDKALSKVPADRYPTIEAFVDALEVPDREPQFTALQRLGLAAVPVALAVVAVLWLSRPGDRVLLDHNKVAVFPLAEHGLPASVAGAGYDVAIMITTAFDQAAPLKWIDVRPWLAERERADPDLIRPERAAEVARARGARYYVSGLVRGGDTPSVHVRLFDALADTLVTQRSSPSESQGTSLTSLGLLATKALLAAWLDPGRAIDLSPIEDRHADAIAFWILGERSFRRARFGEALAAYRRALEHDSALALAAVKGAQAANWKSEYDVAHDLAEWALEQRQLLPAKYEKLARGMRAYFAGQPDTAVHWLQQALADDPDWAEAHAILGEVYFHLVPLTPHPINTLAREAFETAVHYDSVFSEPLMHLAEFAIRAGDVPRARTLIDRMQRDSADAELRAQLRLMLRCFEDDGAWEASRAGETVHAFRAATSLAIGGLQAGCAERGFAMVLATTNSASERWGAFLGLQGLLASQNRVADMLMVMDSITAVWGDAGTRQGRRLLVLDALAGADVGDRAAAAATRIANGGVAGLRDVTDPGNLWLLGWWYASRGNGEGLQAARGRLEAAADSLDVASAWEYLRSLDALLALSRGDTAAAMSLLESIVPVGYREMIDWDFTASHPMDRLLLARLHLAREEWRKAMTVASVFDHSAPIVYLPFVAPSLELRYRAAVQAGDRPREREYRRRLEALGRQDLLTGSERSDGQRIGG
jgi:Tfp pilus assembly protein PilF